MIRQYIGARYVPKFFENPNNTAEWLPNVIYEPLTIVTYGTNSYTSKKTVPASVGDPANNPEYWVATGNINAQIADLTEQVNGLSENVSNLSGEVETLSGNVEDFSEEIESYDDDISVLKRYNSGLAACHRGYTLGGSPNDRDNSPWALRDAAYNGFNACEVDPRKDVNGVIVLLHDADVSSVCLQSGNISELDYRTCFYKNVFDSSIADIPLITLDQAIAIAKQFKLFFLFDMGKETCTISEIVELCESLNYKNYGFFNCHKAEVSAIPKYAVLIPQGVDLSREELESWISARGSNDNILTFIYSWTAEKQAIADDLGIMFAGNQTTLLSDINSHCFLNIYETDLVGSTNKPQPYYYCNSNMTLAQCADAIPYSNGTYSSFTVLEWIYKANGEDNALGTNSTVLVFKPSTNWITMYAFSNINDLDQSFIWTKVKRNGVWSSWQCLNQGVKNVPVVLPGTELSTIADGLGEEMTAYCQKLYDASTPDGDSVLGTNCWITIYKASNAYTYMEAQPFGTPTKTYYRNKAAGVWGNWTQI